MPRKKIKPLSNPEIVSIENTKLPSESGFEKVIEYQVDKEAEIKAADAEYARQKIIDKAVLKQSKKRVINKQPIKLNTVAISEQSPVITEPVTETKANLPQVKKTYGKRAIMLGIFGSIGFIGVILLLAYVLGGNNMVFGFIAIPFLFGGGLGFYYHWNQAKDLQVRYVGDVPTEQVNSMTIYPDKIVFENVNNPQGFVWHWIDDGKPYYVNWLNPATKRIEPYMLPDQQYYDPEVFAQRVLMLPCHRKIFARKQDILTKLKPAIAGLIGIGIWILILTTTGTPTP